MNIKRILKSDLYKITNTYAGEEIAYNKTQKKAYLLLNQDWDGECYYNPLRVQYNKAVIEGYRANSKKQDRVNLYPVYKKESVTEDLDELEFAGFYNNDMFGIDPEELLVI